jgi:Holliday junction resolvase-like predicted endonuclease
MYLASVGLRDPNLRFDVLAVDHRNDPPALRWIRDAFRPESSFYRPPRRRFSDS